RFDVLDSPRNDDADRHVPVVRSGRRVQDAVTGAEADLTRDLLAQLLRELGHRTANAAASALRKSTPSPARERSGRTAPFTGSSNHVTSSSASRAASPSACFGE